MVFPIALFGQVLMPQLADGRRMKESFLPQPQGLASIEMANPGKGPAKELLYKENLPPEPEDDLESALSIKHNDDKPVD